LTDKINLFFLFK